VSARTRPRRRRGLGDDSGAAALEMALCLPPLVMVIVAALAFGWTQHCLSSVRFALEGASRKLLLNPALTETQLQTLVRSQLTGSADPNVTVHLAVSNQMGSKVATLTGAYTLHIGIPTLATVPIASSTSVTTAMPLL